MVLQCHPGILADAHWAPATMHRCRRRSRAASGRATQARGVLARAGPQRLVVLGSEVGGRWNEGARNFLSQLVRVRAHRAPPAIRAAAAAQAVASTALGGPWQQPLAAGHMLCCSGPTLPAQAASLCGPEPFQGSYCSVQGGFVDQA